MIKKMTIPKQLPSTVAKAPDALLFSHVSPDGDCIGSMLALGIALESLGKKIYYFNSGPVPANLRFLPGAGRISGSLPDPISETIIFIDCSDAERVDGLVTRELLAGKNVINIDHHISNNQYGTLNWVDFSAAATGEMIYQLIKKLKIPISKDIAINLYTAIITDTGRFSYSNTTDNSFRIAAELVKTGINLADINSVLFERKTLSQMKLLKKALTNLELLEDGKLAVIVLSHQDFEECGAEESLSEGLVNYARSIENVEAAALLKETDNQEIKVSLRSNSWLDVNRVAFRFGGGGHVRAAGCNLKLPLAQAKESIVAALEEALNNGRNC